MGDKYAGIYLGVVRNFSRRLVLVGPNRFLRQPEQSIIPKPGHSPAIGITSASGAEYAKRYVGINRLIKIESE
jgi:hypothetical protein